MAQARVQYVPNSRGGESLLFNGFKFRVKSRRNTNIHWECSLKGCPATTNTKDRIVTKHKSIHNHEADETKLKVDFFLNNLKSLVKVDHRPVPTIFQEELNKLRTSEGDHIVQAVPTLYRADSSLYWARSKVLPPLPTSRANIHLPDDYKKTINGENFLLHAEENNKFMIFSTVNNLYYLATADAYFCDESLIRRDMSVDEVIRLYKQYGDTNYLGEAVSKTQHSIQCAQIAEAEGSDKQVIIGALLHDIGHLVGLDKQTASMVTDGEDLGAKDHDILGGEYLKRLGFSRKVCEIVKGHVQAKRYLVFKYPEYYSSLSDASKMTLEHQGGKMSENEADKFENSPLFETIISMRRWDEQAKNTEIVDNDIENYRGYLQQVLNM